MRTIRVSYHFRLFHTYFSSSLSFSFLSILPSLSLLIYMYSSLFFLHVSLARTRLRRKGISPRDRWQVPTETPELEECRQTFPLGRCRPCSVRESGIYPSHYQGKSSVRERAWSSAWKRTKVSKCYHQYRSG